MSQALQCCLAIRQSKMMAVIIVFATLMIDNILLTCIVPMLPKYFLDNNISNESSSTYLHTTQGYVYEASEPSKLRLIVMAPRNATGNRNASAMVEVECANREGKERLAQNNILLAILLASKPFVQLFANFLVGPMCDKIGFDIPMLVGYFIMIASSLLFAFGQSYGVLFLARALQGVGSACASTAGMGMIASLYRDDDERGKKIGVAFGGIAAGLLVGPAFGGFLFQATKGKQIPFIILACGTFLIAMVQISSRLCRRIDEIYSHLTVGRSADSKRQSSIFTLLKDPYVLLAALAIVVGTICIGVLETSLPTWLLTTFCASEGIIGVAMLPPAASYTVVTAVFSRLPTSRYRWIICLLSFISTALGGFLMSACKTVLQTLGPCGLIGVGCGMIDTAIFPILGHLADIRHCSSVYGAIYAIGDAALCMGLIVGPILAGTIGHYIGFRSLMIVIGVINLAFSPLVLFFKAPPAINADERKPILTNRCSEDSHDDDVQHRHLKSTEKHTN